jgi:hypothetical protein
MKTVLTGVLLLLLWPATSAFALCGSAANGTVQSLAYLYSTEFQDAQAAGSITPGCIRDLIASVGQGNLGIEIDFFQGGVPAASTQIVKSFSRVTVLPASTSIRCNALVGATASTTVTLAANISSVQSNVGTMVFAAGGGANSGCTATFTTAKTFGTGDFIEVLFPATADATLANVSVSIAALQ